MSVACTDPVFWLMAGLTPGAELWSINALVPKKMAPPRTSRRPRLQTVGDDRGDVAFEHAPDRMKRA
jgi:hypothetical protein